MPRYGCGHGQHRGRCRGRRWIEQFPETTYFKPYGPQISNDKTIILSVDELEALRLVDLEDLTQEEAAAKMGISRKTLWNDLHRSRKKVINALVNGYSLSIQGGDYIQR